MVMLPKKSFPPLDEKYKTIKCLYDIVDARINEQFQRGVEKISEIFIENFPSEVELEESILFRYLFDFGRINSNKNETLNKKIEILSDKYLTGETTKYLNNIIESIPVQKIPSILKNVWKQINSNSYLHCTESTRLSNKDLTYKWFTLCLTFLSILIKYCHLHKLTNCFIISFISQILTFVNEAIKNVLKCILTYFVQTSDFSAFSDIELYLNIDDICVIKIFENLPIESLLITSNSCLFIELDEILNNLLGFPKYLHFLDVDKNVDISHITEFHSPRKSKTLHNSLKKLTFAPIFNQNYSFKLWMMYRCLRGLNEISFIEPYYESYFNTYKSKLPCSLMIRNGDVSMVADIGVHSLIFDNPGSKSVIISGENFCQVMKTDNYKCKFASNIFNSTIKETNLLKVSEVFPLTKELDIEIEDNSFIFNKSSFEFLKYITISPSQLYNFEISNILQNLSNLEDQLLGISVQDFFINDINKLIKIIGQFKSLEYLDLINSSIENCHSDQIEELSKGENKVEYLSVTVSKDNFKNVSFLIKCIKPTTLYLNSVDMDTNVFDHLISYGGLEKVRFLKFRFSPNKNSFDTLENLKQFIKLKNVKSIEIVVEDNFNFNLYSYAKFQNILSQCNTLEKKIKLFITTNMRYNSSIFVRSRINNYN